MWALALGKKEQAGDDRAGHALQSVHERRIGVKASPAGRPSTVRRVIRRSFRMGLKLGLLAGIVVAIVKLVQARNEPSPASPARPWTPLDDDRLAAPAPRATPAPPPAREPKPEPVVAAVDTIVETDAPAIVEPLDDEAAEPVQPLADVPTAPPEPVAPVEKSVEPPKKAPPRKQAAAKKAPTAKRAGEAPVAAWIEPVEGLCPSTHPVKAKLSSMIFHLPGMFAYDRTKPDRCYRDGIAAEADGLRAAKR